MTDSRVPHFDMAENKIKDKINHIRKGLITVGEAIEDLLTDEVVVKIYTEHEINIICSSRHKSWWIENAQGDIDLITPLKKG